LADELIEQFCSKIENSQRKMSKIAQFILLFFFSPELERKKS